MTAFITAYIVACWLLSVAVIYGRRAIRNRWFGEIVADVELWKRGER